MTAGRSEHADVQYDMPDLYGGRPDDRHDDPAVLIRRMLASSASLLDHLDECPVCREDGCRWCDSVGTYTTMLRYDRANLDTMYRAGLARSDGHPTIPPHLVGPGPHTPPEHLTGTRPVELPHHLAKFAHRRPS